MMASEGRPELSPLRLAVGVEGALLLLALVLGRVSGFAPFESFRWELRSAGLGLGSAVALAALAGWAATWRFAAMRRLVSLVEWRVLPLFRGARLTDLALISALAGVCEEALFRGVVQPGLTAVWGPLWGIIASAMLFGLVHPVSPLYATGAALIGLILGAMLNVTGNLLAPIVLHGAYDFLALWYLTRRFPGAVRRAGIQPGGASGPEQHALPLEPAHRERDGRSGQDQQRDV